jgi:uncharacterized protein YqgC (DUF456 family)
MSTFARILPVLLIVVAGFALYQLFIALTLASKGQWPFAAVFTLMSIAGWALARVLWNAKRKMSAGK